MNTLPLFARIRLLSTALFLLPAAGFSATEGWEKAAILLYTPASVDLMKMRAMDGGDSRLGQYARALEEMHAEPVDSDRLIDARRAFEKILAVGARDDIGVASRYYLARLVQLESGEAFSEASSAAYNNLFQMEPDHFFGQMAFVRHALLEIHANSATKDLDATLNELEETAKTLTIGEAQRHFHRAMGETYLYLDRYPQKAFDHLKAAYEIGSPSPLAQRDLTLVLAELAEKMNRLEYALLLYKDYVEKADFNQRRPELIEKIARLSKRIAAGTR